MHSVPIKEMLYIDIGFEVIGFFLDTEQYLQNYNILD